MKLLVKSLEIENLHATRHKIIEFSSFNYFYGSNGVGKSTVLEGLQLAMLGYIPGYQKTPAAIMQHCLNDNTLRVCAKFVDTDAGDAVITVCRSWMRKGSSVTKSVEIVPESYTEVFDTLAEIPAIDFNRFSTLTANAQKSWFIANVCDSSAAHVNLRDELGWNAVDVDLVSDDLYAQLDELLETASGTSEGCAALNKQLKDIQSIENSKLSTIQGFLKSCVQNTSSNCSNSLKSADVDIEDVEKAITSKRAHLRSIQAENALIRQSADLRSQISQLESALQARDASFIEAREVRDDLDVQIVDLTSSLRESTAAKHVALTELARFEEAHPAVAVNVCPYTSDSCATAQAAYDEYQMQFAAEHDRLASAVTALTAEADSITKQLEDAEYRRDIASYKIRSYVADRDTLNNLYEDLTRCSASGTELDTSALEGEIGDLQQQLVKLIAAKQVQELYDLNVSQELKVTYGLNLLSSWVKATGVTGLQSQLSVAPFHKLEKDINRFVVNISDIQFAFNCEVDAKSFSFGVLDNNNKYIPYTCLSAGEQAKYCCLLLSYLVARTAPVAPIIIVDDMFDHVSEDRFNDVLAWFVDASARAGCQVVAAGVQPSRCGGARSLNNT